MPTLRKNTGKWLIGLRKLQLRALHLSVAGANDPRGTYRSLRVSIPARMACRLALRRCASRWHRLHGIPPPAKWKKNNAINPNHYRLTWTVDKRPIASYSRDEDQIIPGARSNAVRCTEPEFASIVSAAIDLLSPRYRVSCFDA